MGKKPKIPDKKSFLLYCDQADLISKLSDEQAGSLIKHIYSYCGNGRERPEIRDPLTDIVFTALQTSLDRDHDKYLKIVERNRNNGKLGGRPINPKKPTGLSGIPKNPSEPDSDSDSDSDSDIEKDIPDSEESGELFYKAKSGKKLTGQRLETFNEFWTIFNLKQGKASAADSWLKISPLTNNIFTQIIFAAKIEAERREAIISKGGTPKWAQGWLSDRRWEDEFEPVNGNDTWVGHTPKELEKIKQGFRE